ncbi:hypothetical protein ABBQ38_010738 [Trebouxia sp. C0009 RCD-2024]
MHDVQQALETPSPAAVATYRDLTVLVVGAPGLGKTSFIRNLQDMTTPESALDANDQVLRQTNPTTYTFCRNPSASCTTIRIRDGSCSYCYRFQDTPGLASEQVVKAICKYAAKQDQDYLQDQDLRRQYVMADSFDKRVDVCLFFLNPHFVKFEELALMKGMSKLGVPVIPVIAKADSYGREELDDCRTAVMTDIKQIEAESGKPIVWRVDASSTEAIGKEMPFAVITGTCVDAAIHRNWLIRDNAYGSCEELASDKSDNLALKALLFSVGFHKLKQHTERRYLAFRRKHGAQRQLFFVSISVVVLVAWFITFWMYSARLTHTQHLLSTLKRRKCPYY